MKTSYDISGSGDTEIITAKTAASIFGRRCSFEITSYTVAPIGMGEKYISIFMKSYPDDKADSGFTFDSAINGTLRIQDGFGGNSRCIEQKLDVPYLSSAILGFSNIKDGGVEAARGICFSFLKRTETFIELMRRSIRDGFAKSLFSKASKVIDDSYVKYTNKFLKKWLGELHWPLFFSKTDCGEECLRVIDYTLNHNFPTSAGISDTNMSVMELSESVKGFDLPTIKASALLRNVCGDEVADEFFESGAITIRNSGYTFNVKPGSFVTVVDPHGKTARLCIHTVNLSCHFVDELTIAYLNIKHRFKEYFKTAIRQSSDPDFLWPV